MIPADWTKVLIHYADIALVHFARLHGAVRADLCTSRNTEFTSSALMPTDARCMLEG